MAIRFIKGGLQTTVQDNGRTGYRKEGIIVSGAMDLLALRLANLLLGNPEHEAGLECTLTGPEIYFESDQLIAISGGDLSPMVNEIPVKMWSPLLIKKGDVLHFGRAQKGCRTYITVQGGFEVPLILGSRSTYLKAGIGGWQGRQIQKGDVIPFRRSSNADMKLHTLWSLNTAIYPDLNHPVLRILPGPEYDLFTLQSQKIIAVEPFQITKEADRMGYRLQGPKLSLLHKKEMLSAAVSFGTIQVSNDSDLIILAADHQTTGGYPRIGQIITADLTLLAQLKSGQEISFKFVTLTEANETLKEREQQIRRFKHILNFKHDIPG